VIVAEFAGDMHYDDLPPGVVRETKRLFLDSIGCALAGINTQKGEIAVRLAQSLGGPAQASLLGVGKKVSAASSAFATGELLNALDYEALLSPPDHATPYVMAAPLAMGEMNKASGRELIVALAVAHELATRIASSLVFGNRFAVELPERGMVMSLPAPGYGMCTFAGAAAAGRLSGLKAEKIAHAIVAEHDLKPEDIQGMTVRLNALAELPVWQTTSLETHIDVQFSVPFVLSLVAHRIERGPSWQAPEILKNRGIADFMEKVRVLADLDDGVHRMPDVEITVGTGATRKVYEKRGPALGYIMSDDDLIEKFKGNARSILNKAKIEQAVDFVQNLEHCPDIAQLFPLISF
jgi:2-methylcitrate dehydratase PrpD